LNAESRLRKGAEMIKLVIRVLQLIAAILITAGLAWMAYELVDTEDTDSMLLSGVYFFLSLLGSCAVCILTNGVAKRTQFIWRDRFQ
jgi:hypothetical protein